MPSIIDPNPIVVPPVPEKTFDEQFIQHISINAQPNQPWVLFSQSVPYDGGSEVLANEIFHIDIQDIKAIAAVDAGIAATLTSLVTQLGRLFYWSKKLEVHKITPEFIAQVQELEATP